jgi:predicted MFS family arabinose efflux permease
MGIFAVNMPLATVVALPVASALSVGIGWRYAFYLNSALGMVATLAFAALFRERPMAYEKERGIRRALGSARVDGCGFYVFR